MPAKGRRVAAAVAYMTLANALHFGAYELARSAVMALFTSNRTATASASTSAMALATGLVSPVCVVMLYGHRRVFDAHGPRRSLLYTTLAYAACLSATAVVLQWAMSNEVIEEEAMLRRRRVSQVAIVFLFVVKNAFVQLLAAQHWSFLTSVLSSFSEKSAGQLTPVIAGIGSVTAAVSGWLLSPLLKLLSRKSNSSSSTNGLIGLLNVAAGIMVLTAFCSDEAYRVAQKNQFAPTGKTSETDANSNDSRTDKSSSLLQQAKRLFRRLPVLQALCIEVVVCQSISSFMSFLFVSLTKEAIPVDAERARHMGVVYARINIGSGILQFGLLPLLLGTFGHAPHLWLVLPTSILVAAVWMTTVPESLLTIITVSFCIMKILEYSLRVALTERVYGPLDEEGRFLGKEIICMFANRMGKSATAVVLAISTAAFPSFLGKAPIVLSCACTIWLVASVRLTKHQFERETKIE